MSTEPATLDPWDDEEIEEYEPPATAGGDVAQVAEDDVDLLLDAEREDATTGYYSGPVDAEPGEPATVYGTIIDSGSRDRVPVLPAWLRSHDQRAAFVRETLRLVGYLLAFHAVRSPKYVAKTLWFAPAGVCRLAGRQLRWWWHPELSSMLQQAADRKDLKEGRALHHARNQARKARGLWLTVELAAVALALTLLLLLAPFLVQLGVPAALAPVLARLGRPADKPITDRVYTGPKFTRLHAEMVREAMCRIGISGIKEPGSISFPEPGIHRAGPGWLARINLPAGVEAVDVLERRGKLSSALRLPVDQVWPSLGPDHAGQIDLWVGYLPASKMGQPMWSLLADGVRTSVFEEYEFGTDQRQRPVKTRLFARNFLVGGVPGSGKSYGARALATIAVLDPTCEMKIAEFKGTGDFLDMAPLCSTYACGVDDEAFQTGLDILLWGLAEAERRGARIRQAKERGDAPEGKVTPELAGRPGSGLHPVFILLDEVHELFGDDEVGKDAAKAAIRLVKRGRALNIIVVLATQIPDKDSLPPALTRCITIRWCMAVQDQIANDMILGTGAYKRGMTATAYRPGDDAGWGICLGIVQAGPVRSQFPTPEQTKQLMDRATAVRDGVVVGDTDTVRERRDLLADVKEVFARTGERRLHRENLLEHLTRFWPDTYTGWTADMLGDALRAAGVPVVDVKILNVVRKGVKVEEIQSAIANREPLRGVAAAR